MVQLLVRCTQSVVEAKSILINLMLQLQLWTSAIAMLLYRRFARGDVVMYCPFSFPISNPVLMSLTWMLMTVVEIRCWVSTSIALEVERFGRWWSSFLLFRINHVRYFMSFLVVGLEIWVVEFCDWVFVYVSLRSSYNNYRWVEPFQYNSTNSFVCECSCMSPYTPAVMIIDELKPSNTS